MLIRLMKLVSYLLCMVIFAQACANDQKNHQTIVQLADYISVDYSDAVNTGKIISQIEYKEMQEFVWRISELAKDLKLDSVILNNIQELNILINNKAMPDKVASKARAISLAISQQFNLILPPKTAPNLAIGADLYQKYCTSCHGVSGKGDGLLAATQTPSPTNFQDLDRAKLRSINGLYNTITMGVEETGMASYAQHLTADQRWSVAFYVSQLFASPEQLRNGEQQWSESNNKQEMTPSRIISRTLNEELIAGQSINLSAYLRHKPTTAWDQQRDLWLVTQQLLDESFKALSAGDNNTADQLALEAYLDGFELLEPVIDTVDSKQRQALETLMLTYRQAVKNNDVVVAAKNLSKVQTKLLATKNAIAEQKNNFFAVLLSATIILLREGLEIILILAVMFAFTKRTEQKAAMSYIHAGWLSAIFVGLGLWYLSHQFIAINGEERELTEGILAVLAAAILFYVGFWIHRQSASQRWQQILQGQLNKQMTTRSLLGLSIIAFIAVFREMLEIALFYETLWLQTQEQQMPAIFSGISIALVLLLILCFVIHRLSLHLPIKKFFVASSFLILVLAVIFLGSGLQALTEAGQFPLKLINIPQIELLGIYPNVWILIPQICVIFISGYVWYRQKQCHIEK